MPTFLHVKEQLQGAQVPDMDPVDSTAHRLPTEVRVLPACCVIAAEEQARAPGSRPIPLMMGRELGPLVAHEKGREEQCFADPCFRRVEGAAVVANSEKICVISM